MGALGDLVRARVLPGKRVNKKWRAGRAEPPPEGDTRLTVTEMARRSVGLGEPLTRKSIYDILNGDTEGMLVRPPTIRGVAAAADIPLPVVGVAALVDAGVAPEWLTGLVETVVYAERNGVLPRVLQQYLEEKLTSPDSTVVVIPVPPKGQQAPPEVGARMAARAWAAHTAQPPAFQEPKAPLPNPRRATS